MEEAQAFIDQRRLNDDYIMKIQELPPELLGVAIGGFGPLGESADWNGKFISYAASIKRAWNNCERVSLDETQAFIYQ